MIIKIPEYKNFLMSASDEKKLEEIEDNTDILESIEIDQHLISVVSGKIGKLMLFDKSIQGGMINYKSFWGGLPYTRYFALSFIINDKINKTLVLGLGSGSVVNDFCKIKTITQMTVVEIHKIVIDLYNNYFKMYESSKLKLLCDDAYNYTINSKDKQDLIILDIFVNDGMPKKFIEEDFLSSCSNLLTSDGMLVINFFGTENLEGSYNEELYKLLATLKTFFPSIYIFPVLYGAYEYYRIACDLRYSISPMTNIILIASKNPNELCYADIQRKAQRLYSKSFKDIYPNFELYARDNKRLKFNK